MSRIEKYERIYLGENIEMPKAVSRIDRFWEAVLNGDKALPLKPSTRGEEYLAHLIDASVAVREPTTNLEKILCAIATGGKLDAATKAAFNDRYLKYIYEQTSGENMFAPINRAEQDGISFYGRTIVLNGNIATTWNMQDLRNVPLAVGDTVTMRYKYKSGHATSEGSGTLISFAPYNADSGNRATAEALGVPCASCAESVAVVTTITEIPTAFRLFTSESKNAIFDNLKFEVSFEKGDTTQ